MRIMTISDLETQGGAARATTVLAQSLQSRGHQLQRVVAFPAAAEGRVLETHSVRDRQSLPQRLARLAGLDKRLHFPLLQQQIARDTRAMLERLEQFRPDVINVHNTHYAAWEASTISALAEHAPVFWTIHDMWSFTGRCAYSKGCERFFHGGCDSNCPTPNEYPALPPERIAAAWQRKKNLIEQSKQLRLICPSRWLAGKARQGFWRDEQISVIPYGISLQTYRPISKTAAREVLGIDLDRFTVLGYYDPASEGRKGEAFLDKLIADVNQRAGWENCQFLILGRGADFSAIKRFPVICTGYVQDPRLLATVYAAADAMVYFSIEDNLPTAVIEAMACGTPVFAFAAGGIPEIIEAGVSGQLADIGDWEQIRTLLETYRQGDPAGITSAASRKVAEERFPMELEAQRYEALFNSCLSGSTPTLSEM